MKVTKQELEKILNKNIVALLDDKSYEVKKMKPIDLLTPNRFDLLAKYIYVKFSVMNIESSFGKEIYLEHIKAFNGFMENDESQKMGKEAFLSSFDVVINSMKEKGFQDDSIIPLATNTTIIDGAHRLATALYLEQDVNVIETNIESQNFNYEYFQNRGLSSFYLDAMASEYAKLKDNVFMILLWPSAEGKEKEFKNILHAYGDIIYQKNIYLNNEGSVHLVKQVYKTESWVGNEKNNFVGARNKAQWCFEKKGPLRAFLFESEKDLIEMKEEVRKLYKIGKHAVHINDTKEETLELVGMLFNDNSIHYINHALLRNFTWFERLFQHYKNWLSDKKYDSDKFCIDGSSTLAAYGIREVRDLDYLYFGEDSISTGYKEIGCHNDELEYHTTSRDEIIFNPINHFLLDGLKFISLDNIKKMKQVRNEEKDKNDVKMIEAIESNKKISIPLSEKLRVLTKISYWKGRVKFFLLKIRYYLTKLKQND